jgi:hypothetical protein
MRVLVACEFSGIVREAFIACGHEAVSFDLLPTEIPGPHVIGDVKWVLQEPWDLVIAHPPCTYLCNSGVRWLKDNPERWEKLREAKKFFKACLAANAPRVAIENPIMHCHARESLPEYTQIIQPWQFGHGETKATCLWLKGLPKLQPTEVVDGRRHRSQNEPQSADRWKRRSRTYTGIAAAMAEQWGSL